MQLEFWNCHQLKRFPFSVREEQFQSYTFLCLLRFLRWLSGKEFTCQCRKHKRYRFNPWVWKIPWSRKWQPTPVFLPGKFHGQRSMVGQSPKVRKELDTAEHARNMLQKTPLGKGYQHFLLDNILNITQPLYLLQLGQGDDSKELSPFSGHELKRRTYNLQVKPMIIAQLVHTGFVVFLSS